MKYNNREKRLIKILKKEKLSVSHELDHLNKVAEIGFGLAKKYKASRDIVVAAALLHDLGRSNFKARGKRSAQLGARLAKGWLKKAGYNGEEIRLVTKAIAEHDQPELESKLLEARILKEADFLDGFGARGILRSVMYAGETGGGVGEALERLKKKSAARLKSLQFKQSKRWGWRQQRLTEFFIDKLENKDLKGEIYYPGKLIVIEGISGSGKDTQAELLKEYLIQKEEQVEVVNHPTGVLKKMWREWRKETNNPFGEMLMLAADRARMVDKVIIPGLKRGQIIISTRSSISAQVYQKQQKWPQSFYRLVFSFEPVADLILYLNISGKEALKRADKRIGQGRERDRGFFGKNQENLRRRYSRLWKYYPNVIQIDGSKSIKKVHKSIVERYERHFD